MKFGLCPYWKKVVAGLQRTVLLSNSVGGARQKQKDLVLIFSNLTLRDLWLKS